MLETFRGTRTLRYLWYEPRGLCTLCNITITRITGWRLHWLPTAFYFIPSAMTGFIVNVFPFRNRVSYKEAFEGLELGEGKPSRPVLRGPGGRKAAWLLGNYGGPKVRDRLCQLIRQHQLDANLVKSYAVDFCGTKTLREASREQVEAFVVHLAAWAEKDRTALLCQLNSYPVNKEGAA
jgi:hypothetical protein